MWFSYSHPKEAPVAVFTLISVYSKKERFVPGEEERQSLQRMADEANAHKMIFVQVEINASTLFNDVKKEGYDPKKSISPVIVSNIQRLAGGQLPLCLYHRGSTSARFLMELANTEPRSIGAWCFNQYLPTDEFSKTLRASGLVICNTDRLDKDQIRNFFNGGRKQGRKWTWLEIKPIDTLKIVPYMAQYFEGSITDSEGLWFDIETQAEEGTEANVRSPQLNWMPSADVAMAWAGLRGIRTEVPVIIEDTVQPRDEALTPVKFYLRLPPGAKDGSGLSGMIAYCTWEQGRNHLMQQLLYDPERPEKQEKMTAVQMLKFASKHNLGVLTWSTPGKWNREKNTDDLSRKEAARADDSFDLYAEAWERGVSGFVKKYKIPGDDYFLYGISRGAQWAHRLALRKPERFWAINIHVNSSYDKPTAAASQCLWLVTTGDREGGYSSAKRFYAECQQLNYPVIFKAEEALGHDSCREVEALRDEFFDYALQLKREKDAAGQTKLEMAGIAAARLKQAPFIGDYLNQQLFSASEAEYVPPAMRVFLPTRQIANAWLAKYVPEK